MLWLPFIYRILHFSYLYAFYKSHLFFNLYDIFCICNDMCLFIYLFIHLWIGYVFTWINSFIYYPFLFVAQTCDHLRIHLFIYWHQLIHPFVRLTFHYLFIYLPTHRALVMWCAVLIYLFIHACIVAAHAVMSSFIYSFILHCAPGMPFNASAFIYLLIHTHSLFHSVRSHINLFISLPTFSFTCVICAFIYLLSVHFAYRACNHILVYLFIYPHPLILSLCSDYPLFIFWIPTFSFTRASHLLLYLFIHSFVSRNVNAIALLFIYLFIYPSIKCPVD